MRPENPEPGTIYYWQWKDAEQLYLVTKNGKFIFIAYSINDFGLDREYFWKDLFFNNDYKIVERRDLPLYVNFHTGETFLKLIRGERENII
jgi:hypothetical protein